MKFFFVTALLSVFSYFSFAQDLNQIAKADKLYGLSNYWQEVNYNFVYMNKVDKDQWNERFKQLLSKVDSLNDLEYYLELQKLSALLNDGHTQVYLPEYLEGQLISNEFGSFKLFTDLIQGKVVVVRISDSAKELLPIGSELLNINGMPVEQYIHEQVKPYLSVSSPHVKEKRAAQLLFKNLKGTSYDIEIRTPEGKLKRLDIVLEPSVNNNLYPVFAPVNTFSSKWLPNEIYYLKFLSFQNADVYEEFLKVMPDLKKAKGLIIDLRYNGGGSSAVARNIARHFIQDSLIHGAANQSRLIIPTDRALGSFLTAQDTVEGKKEWGLSKEETLMYYKSSQGFLFHTYPSSPISIPAGLKKMIVPAFILTTSTTASAAEDFLIYTDKQSHIKRVGEFTNGSTGQPLTVALPNGGEAWICTKKVTFLDGTEFVGTGISPHIKAEYTLKDLLKSQDSVVDKAVEELKSTIQQK